MKREYANDYKELKKSSKNELEQLRIKSKGQKKVLINMILTE